MVRKKRYAAKRGLKKRSANGKGLSVRVYLEPKSMWHKLWRQFGLS